MGSLNRVFLVCVFLGGACELSAAEPTLADLQKIVSNSVKQYSEGFAKQDAKAIAAMFTAEAEYVDAGGTVFHGRQIIEAELKASFEQDPPGSLEINVVSIRPIAAGLLIEEGVSTFTPRQNGSATRTHYTATHVRQVDGSWLLASVRELESAEATPHEQLKALAWLEGRWREENGNTVVKTEWKWSEDRNFLLSDFTIQTNGKDALKGTHRIGWDAERRQFRSWIFDASGGNADGWWSAAEDGSWSVHLGGIGATGIRRSSVMTYARDGADAIVVTQTKQTQAGVGMPDSTYRVVRDAPPPPTAPAKR